MKTLTDTEIAAIQELYDATTLLQATMGFFVHDAEGLLCAELNYAERRLMAARSRMRHLGLITHVDAGMLQAIILPPPFNEEHPSVERSRQRQTIKKERTQ